MILIAARAAPSTAARKETAFLRSWEGERATRRGRTRGRRRRDEEEWDDDEGESKQCVLIAVGGGADNSLAATFMQRLFLPLMKKF